MNIASERAGLILAIVASLVLTLLIREVGTRHLADAAKRDGEARSRAALQVLYPLILDSLDTPAQPGRATGPGATAEPSIVPAIKNVARELGLRQVEIHDGQGLTRYVSSAEPVDDSRDGEDVRDDPGYVGAMSGRSMGALAYRDELSRFDGANVRSNVIEYYLPIRKHEGGPVIGVFETYIDADPLVGQMNHMTLLAGASTIGVFAVFYWALLKFGRANTGHRIDAERFGAGNSTRLSAALYDQSCDALRNLGRGLEILNGSAQGPTSPAAINAALALGPMVQESIKVVRNLAISLPPPGLEERGLAWCFDVLSAMGRVKDPSVRLDIERAVPDQRIPSYLRVVLYRIVEAVHAQLLEHRAAGTYHVSIDRDEDGLTLVIDGFAADAEHSTFAPDSAFLGHLEYWAIVSEGTFDRSFDASNARALKFDWTLNEG